jgi:osmoprotectant transport system substrate-binding protein
VVEVFQVLELGNHDPIINFYNFFNGGKVLKKMRKMLTIILVVFVSFVLLGINIVQACVGRKITIGCYDNTEQRIICEIMGILIEERTGTKITLKVLEDSMELHRALEANEIQICVEYTGVGLMEILGIKPIKDPVEAYKKVRSEYNKNFNLIWLKTFGFSNTGKENKKLVAAGVPLFAAPVVRKDTLKKFPALSRLLNILKGKIDNKIIANLISKVEQKGKEPKEVANQFLNKLGISFSFTPGVG